jgi:hypothetical protein
MNWNLIEDKSWCSIEQFSFEWVREMNVVPQKLVFTRGMCGRAFPMVLVALQRLLLQTLCTWRKKLFGPLHCCMI